MTTSDNTTTTPTHDGFDDDNDGSQSLIKGSRLKFTNDYKWVTREGEQIPPQRELLPIKISRVSQFWLDGKAESRILNPDEPWPDLKKLNEETPRSQWRDCFGTMKGPHENAYFVYLIDPTNLTTLTYVAATAGGFRCVSELKEATRRARTLRGSNLYPVVTLTDVLFSKTYKRNRPEFRIKNFVPIGPATPPQIAHESQPKLGDTAKNADLDDSIPFWLRARETAGGNGGSLALP